MIDAKDAAEKAFEYLKAIYPNKKFYNLELEEIELSDDQKIWYITLSYNSTIGLLPSTVSKEYKIFKIRVDSGDVVSMKIRKV